MEIAFVSPALKKICEIPKNATKRFGAVSAKRLQSRLADLVAAEKLGDLPAGNPHPLKGSRSDQFALRLAAGDRLVFEAADNPIPTTYNGVTDWKNVTSIRIVFIGDYHD